MGFVASLPTLLASWIALPKAGRACGITVDYNSMRPFLPEKTAA